jgi:hypothetical protein
MLNQIVVRLCVAVAALAAGVVAAAPVRPAVVELYTSQGCSSCPPADALLGELARRPDVLALAFHVDYWDDLGWRDRFGSAQATQRQARYAQHLGLASAYTPQMVIDGREDAVGNDRERVAKMLAVPRTGVPVHVVVRGDELTVRVEAQDGVASGDVVLASYLPSALTAIGRGENAGRELREFNIVRSFVTLGVWRGAAAEWRVARRSLPADAKYVAVLVQQPGPGAVLGATSMALQP